MQQNTKTLSDYLVAIRRYKGRIAGIFLLLIVISLGVALGMPAVYRSTATILIEQQEIPEDLVRSTITSFADQRIQVISQRVMTRANLKQIISKYNLYPDDMKDEPLEVVLEQLRDDIRMNTVSADVVDPRSGRPTQATIAFTVSYDSVSPELAQKVTNELVSLYLNENLKSRTEMTAQTTSFLEDEAKKFSEQISAIEKELADFKEKNVNQLPELVQLNMNMLDRTERELMDVERDIRATKERKVYFEAQLAQISPFDASYGQDGARLPNPSDRLKQLKTTLTQKTAVLSDAHPDVVRLKKEIDVLQASLATHDVQRESDLKLTDLQAQLEVAKVSYSADHPDVKRLEREIASLQQEGMNDGASDQGVVEELPDNPAYIQIQAQLESADIDLAALEKKHQDLTAKVRDYEKRIMDSPQVERRYRELMRDHDNAWVKYKELKDKQMEAQLSQMMEAERKGERFTLIEPPELPEKPIKPNRMAIAFLGLVFSCAGGLGSAFVSETMDQTVRGRQTVSPLVGSSVLVEIPFIATSEDINRRRRKLLYLVLGILMAMVLGLLAIHFLYRPLDVLWYVLMRKFGI